MRKDVRSISWRELYKRVWETPVTRLAKEYGLSDVGFAKICKKYNIPRPPRGYWAKKVAGQRMTKEPLPRRSSDEMIEISPNLSNQFNSTENPKLLKHLERERNSPPIVVAKALRNPQHIEDAGFEWVEIKSRHRLRPGMFVAQVVGRSMEPAIPDGAYCIFRAPVEGTRQGKTVLVQMRDAMDPETGERYTVKRYESEKVQDGDSWRHTRITLKPVNPDFEPIVLTSAEEHELKVLAEFVEVPFHEALQPNNPTEKATNGYYGLDR